MLRNLLKCKTELWLGGLISLASAMKTHSFTDLNNQTSSNTAFKGMCVCVFLADIVAVFCEAAVVVLK